MEKKGWLWVLLMIIPLLGEISKKLSDEGAELCFTYQRVLTRRVKPLADSIKSNFLIECDVLKEGSVKKSFDEIGNHWGEIDFVLHSIAFSEKEELKGKYLNTSRNNFSNTMLISCFSFTEVAHEAEKLMKKGGSLLTLTYDGSQKYIRNYNVMGVAKAALESSVRYLAADLALPTLGSMHYPGTNENTCYGWYFWWKRHDEVV